MLISSFQVGRVILSLYELNKAQRGRISCGKPLCIASVLCGSAGKESTHNAGDLGLIPGLGRSPGERKGYPLNLQ